MGYFYGRDLQPDLDVPDGLIHLSWGGTVAEAWTSAESLNTMDDFRPAVATLEQMAAAQREGKDNFDQTMTKWWNENAPGSKQSW